METERITGLGRASSKTGTQQLASKASFSAGVWAVCVVVILENTETASPIPDPTIGQPTQDTRKGVQGRTGDEMNQAQNLTSLSPRDTQERRPQLGFLFSTAN